MLQYVAFRMHYAFVRPFLFFKRPSGRLPEPLPCASSRAQALEHQLQNQDPKTSPFKYLSTPKSSSFHGVLLPKPGVSTDVFQKSSAESHLLRLGGTFPDPLQLCHLRHKGGWRPWKIIGTIDHWITVRKFAAMGKTWKDFTLLTLQDLPVTVCKVSRRLHLSTELCRILFQLLNREVLPSPAFPFPVYAYGFTMLHPN